MKKELNYDQDLPLNLLSSSEAIRLRPGMFIGSIDTRGFLHLLKGILSDAIYSYHSTSICIEIKDKQSIRLKFKEITQPIPSHWAEYRQDLFHNQFYIGLETLNALSTNFFIKLRDTSSNIILQETFEKGVNVEESNYAGKLNCTEMEIECTLDPSIWGSSFLLNSNFISNEVKQFAYLNKNSQFEVKYIDDNQPCRVIYHFENGLQDKLQLEQLNGLGKSLFDTSIKHQSENFKIEIAFAFREYSVDEPILKSYVNNYYTHENGTHVDGLLKGLTYGIMRYFQKQQVSHYKISEKGVKESLVAFLHIRMEQPSFVGCVKNKLANPEILEPITSLVADSLFQQMESDSETTQQLIRKFEI
jgi:DNA gyrase subunit B